MAEVRSQSVSAKANVLCVVSHTKGANQPHFRAVVGVRA